MRLKVTHVKTTNTNIQAEKVINMEFHGINLNNTSITLLADDGYLRTSAIKKITIETQNSTYELERVEERKDGSKRIS